MRLDVFGTGGATPPGLEELAQGLSMKDVIRTFVGGFLNISLMVFLPITLGTGLAQCLAADRTLETFQWTPPPLVRTDDNPNYNNYEVKHAKSPGITIIYFNVNCAGQSLGGSQP